MCCCAIDLVLLFFFHSTCVARSTSSFLWTALWYSTVGVSCMLLTCLLSGPLGASNPLAHRQGHSEHSVTCPLPWLCKVVQHSYLGWYYGSDRLISLWFYQKFFSDGHWFSHWKLPISHPHLYFYCLSDGFKVALCFNVHWSDHQEFGEFLHIPVSFFGFPVYELLTYLCSFSHVSLFIFKSCS